MSLPEVAVHQQRFFVGDFAVVEAHIVQHGSIELQDVRPSIVVVVEKLGGDAAQQTSPSCRFREL